MTAVQFTPFQSQVSPQLWHQLSKLKIDVLRLSADHVQVAATYGPGRIVVDRESGKEIGLGCTFNVGGEGLAKEAFQPAANVAVANGKLLNFNTIEEFKASDKKALFAEVANEIWGSFGTEDPDFSRFLLVTFADLKKYKFYYWFAFPGFVAQDAWTLDQKGLSSAQEALGADALQAIHDSLPAHPTTFLVKGTAGGKWEIGPISKYKTFFDGVPAGSRIIGFMDPSSSAQSPGWPLLNILAYLYHHYPETKSHGILCWRDTTTPGSAQWRSRFGIFQVGAKCEPGKRPTAVGWERTAQNKLAPRMADLGTTMDPHQLADQALSLNLKLMRWRILPALDLEKVANTKCLLLGAGTLGCYVARTLLAWGVRKITLVDSGKVSFSNPVRQPLFEFEDCLEGGKPKAECAANRLKKIFPGVDATGFHLSIPMPGHPVPNELLESTKKDVEVLERLFDEHDVVFQLMDSRESRWLPTVMGAAKKKIVMNAALGFDTFVVMRHGARSTAYPKEYSGVKLGCYYCNDIVAPKDSLTDRTLDQMCTVTRPGLAAIASSSAVELLCSTLQHPEGLYAPAPPNDPKAVPGNTAEEQGEGTSILGLIPHQIRGYLGQFRNILVTGQQYDKCTGCSETVIQAYEKEGFSMLLQAFNDTAYLEQLTGLDQLYKESDELMEAANWGAGEGSGEDDF